MLVREHIARHHADLTPQLRLAADFVAENPTEIATRSLRAVASRTEMPPVTFTRLARALGFAGYAELKELCRQNLQQQTKPFAERAKQLQQQRVETDKPPLLYQHAAAVLNNVETLTQTTNIAKLRTVADVLCKAKRVYLLGALSSAAITRFWSYIARLAFDNWYVVNEGGGRLASTLTSLDKEDVVIIISMAPHARWSVLAAQESAQTGAQQIVLTNTLSCPAIRHANYHFEVPDSSPQFFSSYASMLVFIETLMGMVVSRAGDNAPLHIDAIEKNNYRLGKYWQA
ncbi:MAG: MurR/RpiR family transcriptional regulator [Thiolinea sp.]